MTSNSSKFNSYWKILDIAFVFNFVQTFLPNTKNLKFESMYFNLKPLVYVFTHIDVSFSRTKSEEIKLGIQG